MGLWERGGGGATMFSAQHGCENPYWELQTLMPEYPGTSSKQLSMV
jgi:hypothetical protein